MIIHLKTNKKKFLCFPLEYFRQEKQKLSNKQQNDNNFYKYIIKDRTKWENLFDRYPRIISSASLKQFLIIYKGFQNRNDKEQMYSFLTFITERGIYDDEKDPQAGWTRCADGKLEESEQNENDHYILSLKFMKKWKLVHCFYTIYIWRNYIWNNDENKSKWNQFRGPKFASDKGLKCGENTYYFVGKLRQYMKEYMKHVEITYDKINAINTRRNMSDQQFNESINLLTNNSDVIDDATQTKWRNKQSQRPSKKQKKKDKKEKTKKKNKKKDKDNDNNQPNDA